MATIKFATNVPEELRLRFTEGKVVPSQFGGEQMMFTAEEGVFYVSEAVGNIIHREIRKQGIAAGEPIEICKAEVDKGKGRKSIEWQVSKVGFAPGEQPDGTFIVPGAGVLAPTPGNAASQPQTAMQPNHTKPYERAGIPAPPVKVPMNVAILEAVQMVRDAMSLSGEQWSDASRQGLVSTILIAARQEGWISMWERRKSANPALEGTRHAA